MKRKGLIIALGVFLSMSLMAQNTTDDGKIYWNKHEALVWKDFKATPVKAHFATALSQVGMGFSVKQNGNEVVISTPVYFNVHGSWVKNGGRTPYLLKHEQVHFDIFEYTTRMARKEMAGLSVGNNPQRWSQKLKRIAMKYRRKAQRLQKRYDRNTKHSIRKKQQAKWNKKIADGLNKYNDYTKVTIKVTL